MKYRLIDFDELINNEIREIILKYINHDDFYTEQDILKIEQTLGIKIFRFATWQTFTEVRFYYPKSDLHFQFYWKQISL